MDRLSSWIQRQHDLLALELKEEEAQLNDKIQSLSGKNCELEGLSLLNLEVLNTQSELFGRCSVVLQKIGKHPLSSGFKVGDEVNLFSPKLKSNNNNDESSDLYGIVKHVTQQTIQVVIDEYSNFLNETPLRLDKRSSLTTHSKMTETLKRLKESRHPLADLLFTNSSVDIFERIRPRESRSKLTWFSSSLNVSQKMAVKTALEAPRVAIIHGPVRNLIL
ncbi:hypothetical protein EON65_04965 [archaeon]|nr:MAG: hypothetical protein EON65_04965 [archaeon]